MSDAVWQDLLCYWNSEEYEKLSKKGKNARASKKGGSLYTAGAISQIVVRDKMEKDLGREITQEELFKATHIRKKKKPTYEDRLRGRGREEENIAQMKMMQE